MADIQEGYQRLIQQMPDAFANHRVLTHPKTGRPVDYIFLQVNNAFEEMTGLCADNIIGKRVTEVLPGIESSGFDWIGAYGEVALTGKSINFEQWSDPLKRWYKVIAYKSGTDCFVTLFQDVTQYKQQEETISRSNRQMQILLDNIQTQVWYLTSEYHYGLVNHAHAAFLGKKPEEITNRDMYQIFPREVVETCRQSNKLVFDKGTKINSEEWVTDGNGQQRLLSITKSPSFDQNGKIELVVCSAEDITDRKKAEEALFNAYTEWKTTFDSISDPIALVDTNRKIRRINQAFADYFNVSFEQARGMVCCELIHGPDNHPPECGLDCVIKTRQIKHQELFAPMLSRHLEISMSPVIDGRGEAQGAVNVIKDITDRRLLEARQRELNQKAELYSRLACTGDMAAGVAHEINNPLTGVIGVSSILLKQTGDPDTLEQLKIINEGANRVKEIVNRLLIFSRHSEPAKKLVDIREVLENTLKIRQYVLNCANISVTRDYASCLPPVNADTGQMQQVFLNLILNAEQAMRGNKQGGRLNITARVDQEGHVLIDFEDNGHGIPDENIPKLFNPFYTTKDPGQGIGLGLSVIHSIISEHGGSIEVKSKPGEGSVFTVLLPVEPGSVQF